jgi:hypothetical protein
MKLIARGASDLVGARSQQPALRIHGILPSIAPFCLLNIQQTGGTATADEGW